MSNFRLTKEDAKKVLKSSLEQDFLQDDVRKAIFTMLTDDTSDGYLPDAEIERMKLLIRIEELETENAELKNTCSKLKRENRNLKNEVEMNL